MNKECPCGSGAEYQHCCAPLHQKASLAETAESLMRSRYSAYVLQLSDYLRYSWHPQTRPEGEFDGNTRWQGLEIVQTRLGQSGDKLAYVEFIARFTTNEGEGSLHELSRFQRFDGRWVYVDGEINPQKSGVGRNAPCPCGSGRKYKQCCDK